MMAFITRCWSRLSELREPARRFAILLAGLLLVALAGLPALAQAGEVSIRNPAIAQGEEGIVLAADVTIELGQRLEEALVRGVPLYFVREFEMSRPRWYWIDDKRFAHSQTFRLYYHALTRQYRVGSGAVQQSFSTLEEAVGWLAHLRGWLVVDKSEQGSLKAGENYQASLRIRLDSSQLPKPLQINILFLRDWELAGEARWTYTVPEAK